MLQAMIAALPSSLSSIPRIFTLLVASLHALPASFSAISRLEDETAALQLSPRDVVKDATGARKKLKSFDTIKNADATCSSSNLTESSARGPKLKLAEINGLHDSDRFDVNKTTQSGLTQQGGALNDSMKAAAAENHLSAVYLRSLEDQQCALFSVPMCNQLKLKDNMKDQAFAFDNVGLQHKDERQLFTGNPELALNSEQEFQKHLLFFKSIGVNQENFHRVISVCPSVLSMTVELDLKLTISLLESALNRGETLVRSIVLWPSILQILTEENFKEKLGFLLRLGFKKESKELARALNCVLGESTERLQTNIKALVNLGLSPRDVNRIVKAQPIILQQNEKEAQRKLDYFLNTICLSVEDLSKHPSFLVYDLESRIKPRYNMHTWLKSKGFVRRNFTLDYILSMSDTKFLQKFVESHENGRRMYTFFKNNSH